MASGNMFDDAFDFNPFDLEALETFSYGHASQDNKPEDNFVMEGLEPFFYNKAQSERWAEEMERQRRKKEEEEQMEAEKERRSKAHKKVRDSIMEFDPKVGHKVYTRFFLRDFSVFDINEKCKSLVMNIITSVILSSMCLC
jgi:hypothetical protein